MSGPVSTSVPLRLFLDAGVILDGCFNTWGTSKAALVPATLRENFTVVLAETIEREVQRAVARKTAALDAQSALEISQSVAGWLARVRLERHVEPSPSVIRTHAPAILPAIRHVNDLPSVVTAVLAQPDWVISTNTTHWNAELGKRTGLRLATPLAFLRELHI